MIKRFVDPDDIDVKTGLPCGYVPESIDGFEVYSNDEKTSSYGQKSLLNH